jgi:hypothetical protein
MLIKPAPIPIQSLLNCPAPIFGIVGGVDFLATADPPIFPASPIKFFARVLGFAMKESPGLNYDGSAELTLSIGLSANSPLSMSWCGKRSVATGSSRLISGMKANRYIRQGHFR